MMKKEKGIALVSLIITIGLMLIISSTVVYISLDRFQINEFNKMVNDIGLLEDKVSNYYLKYGVLPVLRDRSSNEPFQFDETKLTFTRNPIDNYVYYILDLEALDGISLNYGKDGFEAWKDYVENSSGDIPYNLEDVYIINENTHTIYYVKGINLKENNYYYIKPGGALTDNIPPSRPQINIISGKKIGGIYTTDVEIEITQGKDKWSGIGGTQYSLDNGITWQEMKDNSQIISINEKGSYTIRAKSYDNATNKNYSAETELTFEIDRVVVGTYINYDEPYTDMYSGIEYTSTNGWRYLGTDDEGNKLLISTAIPVVLNYCPYTRGEYAKWWDTDATLDNNIRASNGMINNFTKIPYTQTASGISVSTDNIAIGRFAGTEVTVDGTTYTAIGDAFKSSTYASKIENVRTLTLAELNRATNSATGGSRAETSTESGFKDLTDEALGLFDMQDLTGYTSKYSYWLATPYTSDTDYNCLYNVGDNHIHVGNGNVIAQRRSCGGCTIF